MSSLGQAFPLEQGRCRELLGWYIEQGGPGAFGRLVIEDVLKRADEAASSGDPIRMLQLYEEMRGLK